MVERERVPMGCGTGGKRCVSLDNGAELTARGVSDGAVALSVHVLGSHATWLTESQNVVYTLISTPDTQLNAEVADSVCSCPST